MKDRVVAILDVDQTLAGGVVAAHLRKYNADLGLGMTDEQIEEADRTYPKTFDVPQIRESRQKDEQRFQQVRTEIRTSHDVHLGFSQLPGSVEAVQDLLAEFDFGGYYTVRPNEVYDATKQWLNSNGFPSAERVVICANHEDKLRKIAADYLQPDDEGNHKTVLLVDDSLGELVNAVKMIVDKEPVMKESFKHLIIVGFGKTDKDLEGVFYPEYGVRTLALPTWQKEHVSNLKANFQ